MKKKNKGFTLTELILVLAVLAIMITILVAGGGFVIDRVNEVLAKSDAKQFMTTAQVVFLEAAENQYEDEYIISSATSNDLFDRFVEACEGKFVEGRDVVYSVADQERGIIETFEFTSSRRGDITVYWDTATDTFLRGSGVSGGGNVNNNDND